MTPEEYDPPTYGGTPQQEAHAEMIQIFGSENPDKEYILTDYDVWEKNPYYHGPAGPHPEDDEAHAIWLAEKLNEEAMVPWPPDYDDTEDPPSPMEQCYRDHALDLEDLPDGVDVDEMRDMVYGRNGY